MHIYICIYIYIDIYLQIYCDIFSMIIFMIQILLTNFFLIQHTVNEDRLFLMT